MSSVDLIPSKFKRASTLSSAEIEEARHLLKGREPFNIYFNAAINDASKGIDNRWFYFSPLGGLVMGIDFDGLRVFSIIGDIDDTVLAAISTNPLRTEVIVLKSTLKNSNFW